MSVAYQSRLLGKTDKEIFSNERLRQFYCKALIPTDKKMQELWHKQNTTVANILTINSLSIHEKCIFSLKNRLKTQKTLNLFGGKTKY